MGRRDFLRAAGLLPFYAVLQAALQRDLFAARHRPEAWAWLRRVHEISEDLRGRALSPVQWQEQVEALFGGVALADLVALVDLDRVAREVERPRDRAAAAAVRLPAVEGLPAPATFATKVFALRPGVAIVPHGHRNMVSMHVVLGGALRVRHYDRLQDDATHLVLRPTIDRHARKGDLSSISSDRDNVHWLHALAGPAFTLDVIVDNLDPRLGYRYEMDFVDPVGAEPMPGGRLRARRISFERALALYGPAGAR